MAAPSQEYLKTKVMTASPEMLTLMLWDGAIRFAEQGKEAIVRKEIENSFKGALRAQKIVMELSSGLKHSVNPDLCGKLSAIYNFIYRRLVDANLKKEAALVDDALGIMRHQRETWVMLMDQLGKERAAEARTTVGADAAADCAPVTPFAPPAAVGTVGTVGTVRRNYPAFATRPAAVSAGLSVEG